MSKWLLAPPPPYVTQYSVWCRNECNAAAVDRRTEKDFEGESEFGCELVIYKEGTVLSGSLQVKTSNDYC